MREACIILPDAVSSIRGALLWHDLERDLCDTFGGFTMAFQHGGWKNGAGQNEIELVRRYTVAINESRFSPHATALIQIAHDYGRRMSQQSVYVRHAAGDVSIYPLEPATIAA